MAKKKQKTPEELIKAHEENVLQSLIENGLNQHLVVHFPNRRKPPLLAQFCIGIINSLGGIIATKYSLNNGTINTSSRRKK